MRRSPLLLTGPPGVGKTTLARRVAERCAPRSIGGFTTEEIREKGWRLGFRIVPFRGAPSVMAHVSHPGAPRVGRYGVDVAAIDHVVRQLLEFDFAVDLHVVDEIGKMECLSPVFAAWLRALLESGLPLVATVARTGEGLIAEVKRHPGAELWEVNATNRDGLVERVLEWIDASGLSP